MIRLNKLYDLLGNDKHIVGRFLDLYCQKMPELMAVLKQQINNGCYTEASITAHEIKSQSAYLGMDEAVETAGAIEAETEAGGYDTQNDRYHTLVVQIETALNELKNIR